MRIVHVTHSLNPLKGGTSVAVKSLAEGCAMRGVASSVICLDPPQSPWLEGWQVPVCGTGPGVTHFGWSARLGAVLHQQAQGASVVVVHGLWQYHNVVVRRICRDLGVPFVVYPHGMLDPWALRQSRLVKRGGWHLVVAPLLRHAVRICFTTENEQAAAAPALRDLPAPPLILPLGVEGPPGDVPALRAEFFTSNPGLEGKRILLFMGRLHPKKGVDILLEGFARWRSTLPLEERQSWHLRLTGPPDSEAYLQELSDLVNSLKLEAGRDVTLPGMVSGRLRWLEFAAAEAFILPSHQENFGIVVGEALACGSPVLLSDRVNTAPWAAQAGAGLVAPDTLEGVVELLQHWTSLTAAQQVAMRHRALELFDRQFSVPTRCEDFLRAMREVIRAPAGSVSAGMA